MPAKRSLITAAGSSFYFYLAIIGSSIPVCTKRKINETEHDKFF
jgi:hypothetical protein